MPLLSIVVPVYNVELYLDECVKSLIAQIFTDFELILVDDGSTDRSGDICDKWKTSDNRIRVIHKKNGGSRSAIMCGAQNANGKYLGIICSDDWVKPEMYSVLISAMIKYSADMVQCGMIAIDGDNVSFVTNEEKTFVFEGDIRQKIVEPFFVKEATLYPIIDSTANKIFKTALFLKSIDIGFNYKTDKGEDLAMSLLYLYQCNKVVVLAGEANYCYRIVSGSKSHRYNLSHGIETHYFCDDLRRLSSMLGFSGKSLDQYEDMLMSGLIFGLLNKRVNIKEKYLGIKWMYDVIVDKSEIEKAGSKYSFHMQIAMKAISHGFISLTVFATNVFFFMKGYKNENR